MADTHARRADGRLSNQLRPPQAEMRPLLRADGSAVFRFGRTAVIAAVFGPQEPKSRARELFDRATLEVFVRPHIGMPGMAEKQLEGFVQRQLEHIVVRTQYPRTSIMVVLQVVSVDGSVAAVAANAAILALLDAGVAMHSTVMSVTVGVRLVEEPTSGCGSATLLLDPMAAEERICDAVVTVSMDSNRGVLVSSLSSGLALDALAWTDCIGAASRACTVLEAFLRKTMEKRLEAIMNSA
mmetsp:Transcript_106615/g.211762  ORF Transcript_106615/g.211762 Transcript_106615/m.211762 type:complete len:240 (-) Transcript_106615:13-732(-)